jgi:hypothetical protein
MQMELREANQQFPRLMKVVKQDKGRAFNRTWETADRYEVD